MPVPPGFAVTIRASALFLRHEDLMRLPPHDLCAVDAEDPASIRAASKTVQELVLGAPLPDDVEQALAAAWEEAFGARQNALAALRSSALAEDGVQSFAGNISQSWASRGKRCPRPSKKWWPVSFPRAP